MSNIIPFAASAASAKRSNRRHNNKSWVYIICWRQRGPCKVGITDNPHTRLIGMQVGNPYKLHIWRSFGVPTREDAANLEHFVLTRLNNYALMGEWLDLPVSRVEEVLLTVMKAKKISYSIFQKKKPSNRKKFVPQPQQFRTIGAHDEQNHLLKTGPLY